MQVETTANFDRRLRKLLKKYRSLAAEIAGLIGSLETVPTQGTPLGSNCYKIRIAIKSKGTGKSGGARVITCVIAVEERVVLLTIFDKSKRATLTDQELDESVNGIS